MQVAQIKEPKIEYSPTLPVKQQKQDLSYYPLQARQNFQFVLNHVHFLLNKLLKLFSGIKQNPETPSQYS